MAAENGMAKTAYRTERSVKSEMAKIKKSGESVMRENGEAAISCGESENISENGV
jgi:hypothetical protein